MQATDLIRMNLRHFAGGFFDKAFQVYVKGEKPHPDDVAGVNYVSVSVSSCLPEWSVRAGESEHLWHTHICTSV